jgi:hypothetical protein
MFGGSSKDKGKEASQAPTPKPGPAPNKTTKEGEHGTESGQDGNKIFKQIKTKTIKAKVTLSIEVGGDVVSKRSEIRSDNVKITTVEAILDSSAKVHIYTAKFSDLTKDLPKDLGIQKKYNLLIICS